MLQHFLIFTSLAFQEKVTFIRFLWWWNVTQGQLKVGTSQEAAKFLRIVSVMLENFFNYAKKFVLPFVLLSP